MLRIAPLPHPKSSPETDEKRVLYFDAGTQRTGGMADDADWLAGGNEGLDHLDCAVSEGHIVSTTRNSALPLIMRAYASAAFSRG